MKVKSKHVLMLRRLEEYCETAFSDFFEGKFESLLKYEKERKKVISTITEESGVSIINDEKAYKFFNSISPVDNSKCGKLITRIVGQSDEHQIFNEDELAQLASDWFYSWTCGEDYVENLLEIGKFVLKVNVPENLHFFVEEARQCFALGRYLAVCALSRTILESFLLHLCGEVGQKPEQDEYGHAKMGSVFKIASKEDKNIKKRLNRIRGRANRRIHGDKAIDRQKSKEIFQETMALVQEIFDLHGMSKERSVE